MSLTVVGIGPGSLLDMTRRAVDALSNCDTIIGYKSYIELVRGLFLGREFVCGTMTKETERVREALRLADEGKSVCLVSSGDAGVYGMAGLAYELSGEYPGVEIEVVPGVTAALSGAALLGAPLTHDFAVISLSALLTDWAIIEERLSAAAASGFILCLYNPGSGRRRDCLVAACDIILKHRAPETVTGLVKSIGREGESASLQSLVRLRDMQADMSTTIFVGNASTKIINSRMVTPRGYRDV